MRPFRPSLRFVVALLLASWLAVPRGEAQRAPKSHVSMIASSSRVTVGEPFAIEIRADVSGDDVDDLEAPEFGALELLGRRVSRPFSFSFGFGSGGRHAQVRNEVVYGFTLRAPRPGTYRVPPAIVMIGGRKVASQPLTIEAVGAAQGQAPAQGLGMPSFPGQIPGFPPIPGLNAPDPGEPPDEPPAATAPPTGNLDGARYDQNAFVRTVVDKTSAFVGEQVTVSVYLYVRSGLSQGPNIAREPTTDGFWVHDLLPMQRNLSAVRQDVQGRPFHVYVLRRYAAFPMRPGTLQIGAPVVELGSGPSLFDLLNGPQKPLRREGVPVLVEAKALPAGTPADAFVGSVKLRAALTQTEAKVGDGVSLEVRAEGSGNLRDLRLAAPVLPGVDVLPPEIHDSVETPLDRVGGSRTFRYLLLPKSPGDVAIPPFSVQVFDPVAGRSVAVRSDALSLRVTAGSAAAAPAGTAAPPPDDADLVQFDPPRTESALARRAAPLDAEPWYAWCVLSVPLLAGLAYGARLARARVPRTKAAPKPIERARAQLTEARAQSDVRRGLAGVARALHAGIEDFAGQSLGGFPASAIAPRLVESGLDRYAAQRVATLLTRIDEVRFVPGAPPASALLGTAQEADALLDVLARSRRQR